ncbi:ectoine utilization protein EutC [Mesorhizobium sp. M4B.F.Ca.ET.190.01.1.1]|uniref:ectoine utilization protein EutC n=1 Tax=unclassified Mesorhizobium TaxID=325217 RepID=UPI001092A9B1|nr:MULTISPECIES: ectoine utilization protein EutC [unclassified Mesorhizobium]TGR15151.1 ectoine utilization protein EutC [Mesorhizobium sp. M4B.F.Ca.ET.200.01.1.1]TGS23025.1 ectoine utilization protein EutC [Mesorhizobium sp. M4B.F.Ca.ET.190.01.1.1]TGT33861.1 ectoine utilization protein EutC [Mesorhizobium sp. M4B.F.Ca.ET.172.01.1.1]
MPAVTILGEHELRKVVPLDIGAVECVEDAFHALATKPVVMPPILRLDIPSQRGEIDVKTAYVPDLDSLAIKISSGFFDNPKIGLPSTNGMIVVLSAKTGSVQALLLDNGYLTDVRTAAAGAVAARHLARQNASVATVLGAGVQARMQIEALALVRPIGEVRIWARDIAKAERVAQDLSTRLRISARAYGDPVHAIAGADVVITTTSSAEPVLRAEWLTSGQHVTAMGSDAEHKNEIDPVAIGQAGLYVADSIKQTRQLGELRHALTAGTVAPDQEFTELGQIISGQRPGRQSADQITIADLTGTGIQDTAIAALAVARARSSALGTRYEN